MDTTDQTTPSTPSQTESTEQPAVDSTEKVLESGVAPKQNESDADAEQREAKKDPRHEKRRRFVVMGSLATLLGWLTFIPFSWIPAVLTPWMSMTLTLAGLIMSCIGVRIPAGRRRDLAITSIIASSVLILVFIVFAVIFHILLG